MQVVTRSYDMARTGANTHETILTPRMVGSNFLRKLFELKFDDDPRLEAQPLYMPKVRMSDGREHDVAYVCTMANNVWAFDANNGQPIWAKPVNLGRPIKPRPTPRPGVPHATEIDFWGINVLWGILSTPVIDPDTKTIYIVAWVSEDGTVAKASHELHALSITSGQRVHPPMKIEARADGATFVPSGQKQRAALLLVAAPDAPNRKTLFVAFSMTHEFGAKTHGWVIAFDVATFRKTAVWCTTPHGSGSGVWQAGQGPSADKDGHVFVMTGNYGEAGGLKAPALGDLPESLVKLRYTPPADHAGEGKLEPVAWFTPFRDIDRNAHGDDNFQDYDLGSAAPLPLPGMNLVVGAGKDGVIYVLDSRTGNLGRGSDFSVLKQPPIFFTYFPGFGIDAANVHNLDHLYDGKTHHLHGSPAFWRSPARGPMLFVWGENENLRAWTVNDAGMVVFAAKSSEVASSGAGGRGGMPGGLLAVSSNGAQPDTGIVWTLAPRFGDANQHVVEGILRAYDATALDPKPNNDGTPRLKLLWHSKHIPGNTFNHCKFCPPVVSDGKIFVPTYDGRVDVYGLIDSPHDVPLPTNVRHLPV